jgi:hypothetical protein
MSRRALTLLCIVNPPSIVQGFTRLDTRATFFHTISVLSFSNIVYSSIQTTNLMKSGSIGSPSINVKFFLLILLLIQDVWQSRCGAPITFAPTGIL